MPTKCHRHNIWQAPERGNVCHYCQSERPLMERVRTSPARLPIAALLAGPVIAIIGILCPSLWAVLVIPLGTTGIALLFGGLPILALCLCYRPRRDNGVGSAV